MQFFDSIVLSGGGAKGGFQLGALKALKEAGLMDTVEAIYGTSVGALNSAGYCYNGIEALEEVWRGITKKSDILSMNFFTFPFKTGFYSMSPLGKKVSKAVVGNSNPESVVCYVDMVSGETRYAYSYDMTDKEFRTYVMGSACIPGIMELVAGTLCDGGAREQTPFEKCLKDGYRNPLIILCNPLDPKESLFHWKPTFPKLISSGYRALNIMENEVFKEDIENAHGDFFQMVYPDKLLIDTLEFDKQKIAATIEQGYKTMSRKILNDFKE